MPKITVTKQSGKREPYRAQKVLDSIVRSRVEPNRAQEILAKVESRLFDGISTGELYRLVSRQIVSEGLKEASSLYRLREALAAMDSIDFEEFIRNILAAQGYEAEWNVVVPGACVEHQGDVIARDQQGRTYWVEVKHHVQYHRDTDLGTVVELWGRLQDLEEGLRQNKHRYRFANAWLITNTKFSEHARRYAACKKLRLTGWRRALDDRGREEEGKGLDWMVESLGLDRVVDFVQKAISTKLDKG